MPIGSELITLRGAAGVHAPNLRCERLSRMLGSFVALYSGRPQANLSTVKWSKPKEHIEDIRIEIHVRVDELPPRFRPGFKGGSKIVATSFYITCTPSVFPFLTTHRELPLRSTLDQSHGVAWWLSRFSRTHSVASKS